ncbi:MAG: heparinase II/III family protein [Candidatus Hydrogenedentes bacterium]|nr:heparinase II/III family protein [Candidatus Hydrogenedentota bacterium]
MNILLPLLLLSAVTWEHPAGMITQDTITEVRQKMDTQAWAKGLFESRERAVAPWVALSTEELRRIFPRVGGNVYHNFSCPTDRVRLRFDPFNPDRFTCPTCNEDFAPHTDASIYKPDDRYHGDMYAGWVCLFHNTVSQRMVDMGLVSRITGDVATKERAIELLLLYAEVLPTLPLRIPKDINQKSPMHRQYNRILTYHREGDNPILFNAAQTYELVRDGMTAAQRALVEKQVLQRLLDDIMLDPIYVYDHNNVYQWHRTIVQTALALERDDLIDWSFGFGDFSREAQPEHRSMNRILATHFNPDGAFWELCSGYHLYPLQHLCEFAVLSRNVAAMDPVRFPPERYDLTRRDSPGGQVIHKALTWFMSLAMPDHSMTIVGDSTIARSGMDDYAATAEIGYRYYDIKAVGDYPALRSGQRSWHGLLYGSPSIQQHDLPFSSSNLSSGWVSLRNEWQGNHTWVGLNALIKGGGHQHADRLTLTLYSHDELLALEKSVPYNEATLRVLGTLTPAHNTVTIDQKYQPQGEILTPENTPEIVYFHDGPVLKFAEIHGDKLYPQTKVYRRSVALIEDIVIDLFRVEGGETHDWVINHAGGTPILSLPLKAATFTPAEWLAGGTDTVRAATSSEDWSAQWKVNAVTSRLTMVGSPETQIFTLETYPLDNAVITDAYPPTQTLCVRRTNDAPFFAVWDSWKESPNLKEIVSAVGRSDAVRLTTDSHTYYLVFGGGTATFPDGLSIETTAPFLILRDQEVITMVDGFGFGVKNGDKKLYQFFDKLVTVVLKRGKGDIVKDNVQWYPNIMYDTYGGANHPREQYATWNGSGGGEWPDANE